MIFIHLHDPHNTLTQTKCFLCICYVMINNDFSLMNMIIVFCCFFFNSCSFINRCICYISKLVLVYIMCTWIRRIKKLFFPHTSLVFTVAALSLHFLIGLLNTFDGNLSRKEIYKEDWCKMCIIIMIFIMRINMFGTQKAKLAYLRYKLSNTPRGICRMLI